MSEYVEQVVGSVRTAETHVETEFRDALPETLATVSAVPRYAMMPTPGRLDVISSPEGVKTFYETSRAAFTPTATRHIAQLASDWYVFYEGVPTRRSRATGETYTINTTVLFPKAPDGIVGEFLWEHYDEVTDAPTTVPDGPRYPLPLAAVRSLHLHENYLEALRRGEVAAVRELLADDCLWATRSYLSDADENPMVKAEGRAATLDYLRAWMNDEQIVDVTVLNRLATHWYVFAEELYVLDAPSRGRRSLRLASIYPVASDGRLQGQLGYGTDAHAAGEVLWPRGGRPTWSRVDYSDRWLEDGMVAGGEAGS